MTRSAAPYPTRLGRSQAGITLLEILVAVVVLSLGILGLASLQLTGLRDAQLAYQYTLASQQVSDMAERMRANLAGINAGNYDDLDYWPATPPNRTRDCAQQACDAAQIAADDHWLWNAGNRGQMAQGNGRVQDAGGGAFFVAVAWTDPQLDGQRSWASTDPDLDEDGVADAVEACGDPADNRRCLYLVFRP